MKPDNNSKLKLSDPDTVSDEILPEYRFDYSKARPNRFAQRTTETRTITLDADVAAVFTSEEAVNALLRTLIRAMPRVARGELAKADAK